MDNEGYFIGNLGKDPKVKSGDKCMVVYFSLAVTDFDKKSQTKQTMWFNIQCLGKLAEIVADHAHKGSRIFVKYSIKIGRDKDGNNYYYFRAKNVRLLDKKSS
jgi:single-stranded DNA-binding protein